MEAFVFVVRFVDASDVLDYVLCEFGPFEVAVSVDVDCLEEFD